MITKPEATEYAPFYAGYVQCVPEGSDIITLMSAQTGELTAMLTGISDEKAIERPEAGEWNIKEVLGHLCDTERIFAYRALRIARGDSTPLAGFDQNTYVSGTQFERRPLADLVEEFAAQRKSNVLCFKTLTDEESKRMGTASDVPITTRALLYCMVGHVMHHIESLKQDYGIR